MAAKKTTKKKAKRATKVPAVRYLRYELTNSANPGTETSHYIDLAKDLSKVNRRLYRQGRDYHVKKITVVSSNTPNGDNRISVSTAPDSWVTRMAWKRGFATWNKMDKIAQEQTSGNIGATWRDFKVYLTTDMNGGSNLSPVDNGGNAADNGEWIYSRLITPDGTTGDDEFLLHLLGDHTGSVGAWGSVGLIKSYGESRATVQTGDPNVPGTASDDPLVNVFDYGTTIDEVIDNLEAHNDIPPYDIDEYPGSDGNMPKPLITQDTTLVDGRAVMGGFNAMCGLLELEAKSPIANDTFSVLVELAPGKYRGIHAEMI